MLTLINYCRLFYLAHLSQPLGERPVYRAIRRSRVRSILEIGMGAGLRTSRMIETMRRVSGNGLHYTGIDLFELSPASDGPKLSLKEAHCKLKPTGARIRLVPGDPYTALARTANDIGPCDLIIVAAGHDAESLNRAWFYVPRLLHSATLVLVEQPDDRTNQPTFQQLLHDDIRRRANAGLPRRTAA
jgi:hypothetical protein